MKTQNQKIVETDMLNGTKYIKPVIRVRKKQCNVSSRVNLLLQAQNMQEIYVFFVFLTDFLNY